MAWSSPHVVFMRQRPSLLKRNVLNLSKNKLDVQCLLAIAEALWVFAHGVGNSLVDVVGIVDGTPQYCSRTRFEREPDLPNAFRGVQSRVRPTAEPEPSVQFGVRKFLPENWTEPDFGSTKTKVFVIRPDGVIGAIVHGAEGVKNQDVFLENILGCVVVCFVMH
ncbi:hypothetical protein P692DRAFT_20881356 [Suillus brevipes Sb2]|nr:hypothetical protein P692DRAFT_20881356 [Suillus brevipes Sb2]